MPPHKTASKPRFMSFTEVLESPARLMFYFVCLRFSLYVSSHSLLTISLWILRDMFWREVTPWVSVAHITSSEQRADSINSEIPQWPTMRAASERFSQLPCGSGYPRVLAV